jgi:hypothetical protein
MLSDWEAYGSVRCLDRARMESGKGVGGDDAAGCNLRVAGRSYFLGHGCRGLESAELTNSTVSERTLRLLGFSLLAPEVTFDYRKYHYRSSCSQKYFRKD